ncbi:ATP-citrate synthase alpha chain protein [Orobanche minor]
MFEQRSEITFRPCFPGLQDLDFTFLETNPFILVNGEPCPLNMRGELDDTATFNNFKKVGNLGYATELGNYAEYSEAPNEEEVLQYARVVIDCATADPDGRKRIFLIGGCIANLTDAFIRIIRALSEKECKLQASRMHIYVRRDGPSSQTGSACMVLERNWKFPLRVCTCTSSDA